MKARDRGVKETVILFGMMFVFSGVGCGGGGKSGVDAVSRDVPKEIEIVHPDAGGEDINVATDNREIEHHDVKPDVLDVSDTADTTDTVDVEDTCDIQASQDEDTQFVDSQDSQTEDSKDSQAVDSREVEKKDTSTANKYYLTVGHDDTAQHYGYHRTHGYGQLQPNVYDGHDIDAIIVNHDSDGVFFYFTPLSQYNDFTKITIDFEGFGPAEFIWKYFGYDSYANKNSALTKFFYEHDGKTIVIDSITPGYQEVHEPDATDVTEDDVQNLDAVDSQAGADANQTQDNGDAGTDAGSITNPYYEPVNIPPYDSKDPTHNLITVSNGNIALINDPSKIHHYIEPGDYGRVVLTVSGTAEKRRTLSLYDGRTTHPAQLAKSAQANIKLTIRGSYWVIDRISNLNATEDYATIIQSKGQHNVFNRCYWYNWYKAALVIYTGSNYNTIQKCVFKDQSIAGRKSDGVGIYFQSEPSWTDTLRVHGTKIIGNEFRNINDSIQLIRRWRDWNKNQAVPTFYNGTIIDSNYIWLTPDVYTDGKGNPDPNGKYAYAENAIDIKAGSDDPNNKIIITNNYMWGYRESDQTDSRGNSHGAAIVIHYGTNNCQIENNIIFDSNRGLGCGDSKGQGFGLGNSIVKNNIISEYHSGNHEFALVVWEAQNVQFTNNTIKSNDVYWGSWNHGGSNTFNNNVILSGSVSGSLSGTGDSNYYYNASVVSGDSNYHSYANVSDAHMTDYTFQYGTLIGNIQSKTVTGVVTTTSSPHYGISGSTIGQ